MMLTNVNHERLTLSVLKLLARDFYEKQIADGLKVSRPAISKQVKKLMAMGLVTRGVRTSYQELVVTSLGEKAIAENKLPETSYTPTARLGAHLRLYLPIIRRGRIADWDRVNRRFRNSMIKHKDLRGAVSGLSVRETSKGIELAVKHRKLDTVREIYPLVMRAQMWAVGYFAAKGYELDMMNARVNDVHISIATRETREAAEAAGRVCVEFQRERRRILPADPLQPARTWFDRTPEPGLETNDMDYAECFLRMPELLAKLASAQARQAEAMAVYAEHLKSHALFIEKSAGILDSLEGFIAAETKGCHARPHGNSDYGDACVDGDRNSGVIDGDRRPADDDCRGSHLVHCGLPAGVEDTPGGHREEGKGIAKDGK